MIAETDTEFITIEKKKFLSFISNTDFEKTLLRFIRNRKRGLGIAHHYNFYKNRPVYIY